MSCIDLYLTYIINPVVVMLFVFVAFDVIADAYEHIMGCWDIRKDSRYEADTLEF